jgi:hypothetical protein
MQDCDVAGFRHVAAFNEGCDGGVSAKVRHDGAGFVALASEQPAPLRQMLCGACRAAQDLEGSAWQLVQHPIPVKTLQTKAAAECVGWLLPGRFRAAWAPRKAVGDRCGSMTLWFDASRQARPGAPGNLGGARDSAKKRRVA